MRNRAYVSRSASIPNALMIARVMSTNGLDTSLPVTWMATGPSAAAADISRAERYWLDTVPLTVTEPPFRPEVSTRTGGHPVPASLRARTPRAARPSSRSWIGRSRIRGAPSMRYRPCPAATRAVMNRVAVPDSPVLSSFGPGGTVPPQPETVMRQRVSSTATAMPSAASASAQTRVSSDRPTPSSTDSPWARAATMSARFVMLRDPGGRRRPHTGPGAGVISRTVMAKTVAAGPAACKRQEVAAATGAACTGGYMPFEPRT